MTDIDIDSLIDDAFAGRELTPQAVQSIAEYVAAAGFDPAHRVAAGRRLAGVSWRGRLLKRESYILTAEAHYLRHVVVGEEWPDGTTQAAYESDIAAIARNPLSGVFVSKYGGQRSIGIVGRSVQPLGLLGAEWTLVEYRVEARSWTTAFHLQQGLDYLAQQNREGFRWLRTPN